MATATLNPLDAQDLERIKTLQAYKSRQENERNTIEKDILDFIEQKNAIDKEIENLKANNNTKDLEEKSKQKDELLIKIDKLRQQLSSIISQIDPRTAQEILADDKKALREEDLKYFIGKKSPHRSQNSGRSYMDSMSSLNRHNWEGIAFGMLFEQLFFFIKVGVTLTLGSLCKGTVYGERMHTYNNLMKTNPDLCYNPFNPKDKSKVIYKAFLQDGKFEFEIDKDGNKIQLKPYEVRSIDALANGYYPRPTMLDSLKQELNEYNDKIMGYNLDDELDMAYRLFDEYRPATSHQDSPASALSRMGQYK